MKTKQYILLCLVIIFSVSCENPDEFLDVVPKGRVIPTTLRDFDDLLNNYAILRGRIENTRFRDPDVFMSDAVYSEIAGEVVKENAYAWKRDIFPINTIDYDYQEIYQYVHMCNFILDNINGAPTGDINPDKEPIVRAEAYAQRAFEYFFGVNQYAPHYDPNNPNEPGIAMPLTVDLEVLMGKSTTGEIYDQILSDLQTALDLLPESYDAVNDYQNWRPGRASILALLAEVHLYMGNFQEALTYSNQALGLYDFLYDYDNVDFQNPDNPWLGYNVDGSNDAWTYGTLNKEIIWNRYTIWGFREPHLFHPDLEALYDKDNDRRWYLMSTQTTWSGVDTSPYYCYTYPGERSNGLTTYRLMLTNAEAKVRTGDGAGAIAILNQLLDKRITNFTPLTYVDNATTLQIVKNERRKELYGSALNLYDQKRYHVYGDYVPTFTRNIPNNGGTVTLEPGSEGYYQSISPDVINLNPNLAD